tara:strand:+ start:1116 stop:1619 length:504 start_codon:yes stop_codon:yes gene_type:complete
MNNKLFIKKLESLKLALFDFDGVFTDNLVYVSDLGIESVVCSRSDGIGISRISSIGILNYVISSETNPVVKKRCEKLNISLLQGVLDKKDAVVNLCQKFNIKPEECLFLGNDINDIPALEIVGIPVAVADAFPEILDYVIYKTSNRGGKGAVREICDIIYNFKNQMP